MGFRFFDKSFRLRLWKVGFRFDGLPAPSPQLQNRKWDEFINLALLCVACLFSKEKETCVLV